MSDYLVQTTIRYTVNGEQVKVIRWDLSDDTETYEATRKRYTELSEDGYAHVMQDAIRSTEDIRRRVEGYFFSPETMKAFGTRVGRERLVNGALYFVTSEPEVWDGPRVFTVRVFKDGEYDYAEGSGGLGAFKTSKAANKFLDSL